MTQLISQAPVNLFGGGVGLIDRSNITKWKLEHRYIFTLVEDSSKYENDRYLALQGIMKEAERYYYHRIDFVPLLVLTTKEDVQMWFLNVSPSLPDILCLKPERGFFFLYLFHRL